MLNGIRRKGEDGQRENEGDEESSLRCAILGFAAGLCGSHVIVVAIATTPPHRIIIRLHIKVAACIKGRLIAYTADRRLVLRLRSRWFGDAIVEMLVEGVEILKMVESILSGGQEGLGMRWYIMKLITNGWRVTEFI